MRPKKKQQQEFQVPKSMLLISKDDYVSHLEQFTANTKNLLKEELEKIYRVKQQEVES